MKFSNLIFILSIYSTIAFSQNEIINYNFKNFDSLRYTIYFKNNITEDLYLKFELSNTSFYPTFWEYNKSWQICNFTDNIDLFVCKHEGDLTTNIFFIDKIKNEGFVISNFIAKKIDVLSFNNILIFTIQRENYTRIIFYDLNKNTFVYNNSIDLRTNYDLLGDNVRYICNFEILLKNDNVFVIFKITKINKNNNSEKSNIYKLNVSKQKISKFYGNKTILIENKIFYSKFFFYQ